MKIPIKMFFQNNADVPDLTTGVIFCPLILIFRCIGIYLDIYKNNNFSFTGIETDFICLKALTN